jgi:hypothetical protein
MPKDGSPPPPPIPSPPLSPSLDINSVAEAAVEQHVVAKTQIEAPRIDEDVMEIYHVDSRTATIGGDVDSR